MYHKIDKISSFLIVWWNQGKKSVKKPAAGAYFE
jgi:hypothetical protein